MKIPPIILLLICHLCLCAQGQLRLPNIFGSQMVLQRDKPVRIWGWAENEKDVTVSFSGQEKTITSGKDGKWLITLEAMEANATGQFLRVKSGDLSITYENILVGDLWVCGGQSNMEWRLRSSRDADVEIPSARYPAIRFIRIEPEGLPEPREDFPAENGAGTWQTCSPETIGDCSGVAYFFGQRLHRRLDVPIGLVNAAWGGTMAQHWVTRETLETLPTVKPYLEEYEAKCQTWIDAGREEGATKRLTSDLEKWEALAKVAKAKGEKSPGGKPNPKSYQNPDQGRIPSGALNAMIMPLSGLSVRGILFYQGENNAFGNTWIPFRETFPAVISDWRKIFQDKDLPFGIIQIAGWSTRRSMTYDMNHHTNVIREQQHLTWRDTPNTGLIVSFDANSDSNIHPGRKYPVGDRSARWALSTVHGITDATRHQQPLQWHGPIYKTIEKKENKIVIHFEKTGSEGLRFDQTDARGFYLAGSDQVFHHALARVVGGRGKTPEVEVWCDAVTDPVAVRYAWSNLPLGTLMNGKELPAFPFRSDTWPLKPHYGEDLYHVVPQKRGDQ
ncbi:sialate O-acetylesterase [Akkermansiaceae bacterium]|nr:sialate O-acetylesterase [Akkermansiaceae bacterium]